MPAQSIRQSQFIITYGPGAILEGSNGPRMVPVLSQSKLFDTDVAPADYEITDQRLSQRLLDGAGILRIPSNAELGKPDSKYVYKTLRFPQWSLCTQHGQQSILYRKTSSDSRACPRCPVLNNERSAWEQAQRQAIRFVRACELGHLDDVDWVGIIQHHRDGCKPQYLSWLGGGGALRHVNIVCPICGAKMNLGTAYSRDWPCSGRFPERSTERLGCERRAKILQRGAANLHMAELQTALTIPPRATRLHRLLEMTAISSMLPFVKSKQELLTGVRSLVDRKKMGSAVLTEIEMYPETTIIEAISETMINDQPQTAEDFRLQEFEALQYAAAHGAPPQPSPTPGAPPQFEVTRSEVRLIYGPNGLALRITPVNRLRVVMVQTGYRRLDPGNPPVDCPFSDSDMEHRWYPGVELFGEGVFADLADNDARARFSGLFSKGDVARSWLDAWRQRSRPGNSITVDERNYFHPVFAWWHTLAHRLINALALDSGYSSAAVRERIFLNIDLSTGEANGGVLLYTTQPGGDGTLGGMVALVPEFERVLGAALRNLDACSNDPLCSEEKFEIGKYNGAACYACALASETSCEHRNMFLDRNLLLEAHP